jgi:NAD(P)-dependent dehydrogenase (short-subunit alcohol dehydrogenase family)
MSTFAGKVALVTGGGSGIGRAAALAFAREGASVVVAGQRVPDGEETVRQIAAQNGTALFVPTDVTREADVRALIETTIANFGRLDYAFNNAGNEGRPGPLIEQDEEAFHYTIDANLKGVWLAMKYEIPRMIEQGGGAIVNNASNLAHIGMANMALYTAAKHAVVGLTKASALEYARQGVRINAVSPGPIETPMPQRAFGDLANFRQFMEPLLPLGRVGQPEEVAEAVIWLCANGSSFITGHSLLIDGGYTAQ